MANLRGVLFDIDGTLLDSNNAHARAWSEALKENGYDVPVSEVQRLIGKGGDKVLPQVTDGVEKDSPKGKQITERRKQIFKQYYLPQLHAFPQVRDLLQHIKDAGLKLVIATSASPDELQGLLKVGKITNYFEEASDSGDTDKSKPDPDIIQAALKKGGLSPEEAIMIGDTPYDIEAATKASVRTIAFRCGGWQDPDLKGAIAIYNDPADLLANYDQSPLAQ